MAKTTALDLALDLFKSKGTVTPDQINKHVGKGNYASKYVLYLKLAGHDITTTKQGRTVVSYTYVGINKNVDTSIKAADRRAGSMLTGKPVVKTENSAPKSVSVKAAKPEPKKTAKPAKEKSSEKPVMTQEEIKKATAAIMALREKNKAVKDEVTRVLGSSGAVSSYGVDADWDSANLDRRELGV